MEITKKSKINGTLLIKEIPYEIAKKMMIQNHYSKKWNTGFGKINTGIFKDGKLLGSAVFGNLMNPGSFKNITNLEKGSVVELNRMWIDDELGKNAETILISSSIKIIKNKYPEIKFIQSFADGRLGCGTIYKASNFKYFGKETSLFFEDKQNGEVFHKVPLENTKRPVGFLNKNRKYLDGLLKPFHVDTYRYIYEIDKKHNVKLQQQPYPDYKKGMKYTNYKHPIGVLMRLYIMYNEIGDFEYGKKALNKAKDMGYNQAEIEKEIEKQNKNKSILWFKNDYVNQEKNLNKIKKRRD